MISQDMTNWPEAIQNIVIVIVAGGGILGLIALVATQTDIFETWINRNKPETIEVEVLPDRFIEALQEIRDQMRRVARDSRHALPLCMMLIDWAKAIDEAVAETVASLQDD